MTKITVELTTDDLDLLVEALDSHEYWRLSDPYYRHDGYVSDPGSADPSQVREIKACRKLAARLEAVARAVPA
jgi:hypothetical protein